RSLSRPKPPCIRAAYLPVRRLLSRAFLSCGEVSPILRTMSIRLPPAIDLYVNAENSGDVDALSGCFAPTASVRDEGRIYRGLSAIQQWKADTKRRYNHIVTPLVLSDQGHHTVLRARLDGSFPGSPVTLEFRFVLEDGKIASL